MGLDTTHNAWHGPYSFFSRWRNAVAYAAGWDAEDEGLSLGSGGSYKIPADRIPKQDPLPDETYTVDGETYTIKWSEHYDNSVWLGHWDKDPEDVLDVLMLHSDCEGSIQHRFSQSRWPSACMGFCLVSKAVPASWDGADDDDTDDWTEITVQFVTGLMTAHTNKQDVEFH